MVLWKITKNHAYRDFLTNGDYYTPNTSINDYSLKHIDILIPNRIAYKTARIYSWYTCLHTTHHAI